jgi:hypothetical protein
MPRPTEPPARRTDPETIPLEACRHCAGNGTPCTACDGHGFACVAANLGGVRSYRTRPILFNPGSGLLTVERNGKVERYTLREFEARMDFPCRAFECVRETGVRAGEVYHLLVTPHSLSCDCAGKTFASTARANTRAFYEEREQFSSAGCVHADAVKLLLDAGLFDLPAGLDAGGSVSVSRGG